MRRREFITLVGGVAVWPLAARSSPIQRVALLLLHAENDPRLIRRRRVSVVRCTGPKLAQSEA